MRLEKQTADPIRVMGRDELNIAEFPVALLSPRNDQQKTLTSTRVITLPNGKRLEQEWTISGSDHKGLPVPADQDVLIALLKIGSDQGFSSSKVYFSRSEIGNVIGWKKNGWSMARIEESIERYAGTVITTREAFWNKEKKQWVSHKGFSIIDAFEIVQSSCREELSWVRFGEEFFQSLAAGYIKPLDLTLYFSLKLPLSKRLFRYLDKHQYRRNIHTVSLLTLATANLGINDYTVKRPSAIKRVLQHAHDELKGCGFLQDVTYTQSSDGWRVGYTFSPRAQRALEKPLEAVDDLVTQLVGFGVSMNVARELVKSKPAELIVRQIDVYRYMASLAKGTMRNQAGFLTQAIREEWHLNPPGYALKRRLEATTRAEESPAPATTSAGAQSSIEQILATLSPDTIQELRTEALRQAQQQIGRVVKLKAESPMVESFFKGLVQERYALQPS